MNTTLHRVRRFVGGLAILNFLFAAGTYVLLGMAVAAGKASMDSVWFGMELKRIGGDELETAGKVSFDVPDKLGEAAFQYTEGAAKVLVAAFVLNGAILSMLYISLKASRAESGAGVD